MASSAKMTVAEYIAEYLVCRGVTHVFGILGHGNLHTGQALKDRSPKLTFVPFRHEQNAGHAAAAYARFSGKAAALTASNGPGVANFAAALGEAKISRLPVLVLAAEAALKGRRPMLQQVESTDGNNYEAAECLKPVSRYWKKLEHPGAVSAILDAAFEAMFTPGGEGPAVISIPYDLQNELCRRPAPRHRPAAAAKGAPSGKEPVRLAARMIKKAARPLLIAGGGVIRSGAWKELERLCGEARIPAAHTQSGNGALLSGHPMNLFGIGAQGSGCANNIASKADLIIAVGTRLTDFTTGSGTLFDEQAGHISVNLSRLDNEKVSGLRITGDAAEILRELAGLLKGSGAARAAYGREISRERAQWLETVRLSSQSGGPFMTQASLIARLASKAGPGATVITSTGSLAGDLFKFWPCGDEARLGYYVPFGFSSMGAEIACALGVKFAAPRRRVYVMAGDASFLLAHQELATLAQEKMEAVIIVFDNGGAQSVRRQQKSLGFDEFGNELRSRRGGVLSGPYLPVDYAGIAAGYGAAAFRAETPDEFMKALDLAAEVSGRPSVIQVKTETGPASSAGGWRLELPRRNAPSVFPPLPTPPSAEEMEKSVLKARAAQAKWATAPFPEKSRALEKAAAIITGRKKNIARLISAETGKPPAESERDCERAAQALNFFAENAPSYLAPELQGFGGGTEIKLYFEPRGVIGAIKPWNFPLDLPLWSCIAPALMAGNAVVFKPAPLTSGTGMELSEVFKKAGLPEGLFQVLEGGDETGKALVSSGVDMISFTGSYRAGRSVAALCAAAGKYCSLETGGKDAALIMDDCDIAAVSEAVLKGAFMNSGQVCSGIKRVIAHKRIFGALALRLVGLTERLSPMPMAREEDLIGLRGQIRQALAQGCSLLSGGPAPAAEKGKLLRPVILHCPDADSDVWSEEIFGPVLLLTSFSEPEEALAKLNASKYGLAASIWTGKRSEFMKMAAKCGTGMVFWNQVPRPFFEGLWSGRKQSAGGFSLGRYGTRNFTQVKQVVF